MVAINDPMARHGRPTESLLRWAARLETVVGNGKLELGVAPKERWAVAQYNDRSREPKKKTDDHVLPTRTGGAKMS
jgi:hypothetical protein